MWISNKLLYFAKGYTQLSERKFNNRSFTTFCFLLFVSGILNLISPSDGKSNNMVSAILEKNKSRVNALSGGDELPFSLSMSDLSMHGQSMIRANVTLSSAGKVICVTGDATKTIDEVDIFESYRNRFYFPSNVSKLQDFVVNTTFGIPQCLFCKAISLLPNKSGEVLYKSPPFYLQHAGWGISLSKHIVRNTTLSIHSNVLMSDHPHVEGNFTVRVVCSPNKVSSRNLRSARQSPSFKAEGVMPLSVTFPNVAYIVKTTVKCSLLLLNNATSQWEPYFESEKEIDIPGFTFSDALYGNIFV